MSKPLIITGIILVILTAVFVLQNRGFIPSANTNTNTVGDKIAVYQNKSLDLENKGLTSIPSYVFNQRDLENLNVSNNSLTGSIQSQIGQLVNLKVLDASNNSMTGVPAEIGKLQKLEVLDLSNNQITGLPNELGNLKNLKTLNLSGNPYSSQDLEKIRANLHNTAFILN